MCRKTQKIPNKTKNQCHDNALNPLPAFPHSAQPNNWKKAGSGSYGQLLVSPAFQHFFYCNLFGAVARFLGLAGRAIRIKNQRNCPFTQCTPPSRMNRNAGGKQCDSSVTQKSGNV